VPGHLIDAWAHPEGVQTPEALSFGRGIVSDTWKAVLVAAIVVAWIAVIVFGLVHLRRRGRRSR